jgi:hypothetical protein
MAVYGRRQVLGVQGVRGENVGRPNVRTPFGIPSAREGRSIPPLAFSALVSTSARRSAR